jgi:hypothetical protein
VGPTGPTGATGPAGTYTAGTGITIASGTISANNTTAQWNASQLQSTAVSNTAPTTGQVLGYNGTSWVPTTPATGSSITAGTGIAITGGVVSTTNLAGDVTGPGGANTVSRLQGTSISTTAPTSGQALVYNGTTWAPTTLSGGGALSGTTNYVTKFTSATAVGNSSIFDNGSSVGIGTGTPTSSNKLEVVSTATTGATAIRASLGASFTSGAFTPAAIIGESSNNGVVGLSTAGTGVVGYTTAVTAPAILATNNGGGVGLQASASLGAAAGQFDGGLRGLAIETTGGRIGVGTSRPEAKVHIASPSADSVALYATSSFTGPTNYTAIFENLSTSTSSTNTPGGILAYAIPSASTAIGRGVMGYGGNVGVQGMGLTSSTTSTEFSFGVVGSGASNGADAFGVYGVANGNTATGGTKYGVYGVAANGTTNWGGYFSGNVNITGSIAKASGTFKIDHPLDPANKYLYHSFVESPDMMNIYNGNIVTDAQGYATVKMPDYFDALNSDFRYQLTVIGTFAQAIVKEEMQGNTFRIQTNQPNVKVSWQVTGVREDAYAKAHRVQPEVEKEPQYKGKYIHPVELGKPATSEINYDLNHPKMYSQDEKMQVTPPSKRK